ncbi:MAG: hypothetical protein WC831_03860 [Parcubacteria group bacterium]|jgi:hypothetical protein
MEISKETSKLNIDGRKEKTPEPDFVGVYKKRLAMAKPVAEPERELTAFDYRDTGLKSIEKRIPVVVFEWG